MAHFAKLSEDNIVIQIEVVADNDTMKDGVEDEATGVAFLTNIHGWSLWKKCSYNTKAGKHYQEDGTESSDQSKAFRKNYPHIGWTYNASIDGFVEPQPYSSWTLNSTTGVWDSPVTYPNVLKVGDEDLIISWNESNQKWTAVQCPSLTYDNSKNYDWNTTSLSWDSV